MQSVSSFSGKGKVELTRETDREVRAVDLLVLQKPLDADIVRKLLPAMSRDAPAIQHWAILAIFHPPSDAMQHELEIRMCELDVGTDATADDDNRQAAGLGDGGKVIRSLYSKVELAGLKKLFEDKQYKVLFPVEEPYQIQASPLGLKELGEQISLNGKAYDAVGCNCQHWAKEFLLKLGLECPVHDLHQAGGWAFIAGLPAVELGLMSLTQLEEKKQKKKLTK